MRSVFECEQDHLIRTAKEAILNLETLGIVQRWLELDDLPIPDSISVTQWRDSEVADLRFLDVTERSDYLRITRDYRKALSTGISNWHTGYSSQELITEGTRLWLSKEVKIKVHVGVGIREGCTLTYEAVTVTRPVIVCN